MSKGVNKVILIGNVGQDPEIRFAKNGSAIANVSLATTESWIDKNTNEKQEKTEWHRLVFFARLAEIVGEYVHKGSKIYVEGSLQTRQWEDKSGTERYTTEIKVREMQMLDGRSEGTSSPGPGYGAAKSRPESEPRQESLADTSGGDDFDDDIPFS